MTGSAVVWTQTRRESRNWEKNEKKLLSMQSTEAES